MKKSTNLEYSFHLSDDDIKFCNNSLLKQLTTKNDKKSSIKKRDPFYQALICIVRIKYEAYNPHCTINMRSNNKTSKGYTIYGYCIHRTCGIYKFKIMETNESIENSYKVDTYVDVVNKLHHGNEPKVGYSKGMERFLVTDKLKTQTAQDLKIKMNNEMSKNLAKTGNFQNKNYRVLKKIRVEGKNALNRSKDEFNDLVEMAQANPSYVKNVSRIPFL